MTNLEFKYWLSGYLALSDDHILNNKQLIIIKKHAELVKEISGHLDADVINFIVQVDIESQDTTIHFSTFKELAKACFVV
jgi:hypothetical protein